MKRLHSTFIHVSITRLSRLATILHCNTIQYSGGRISLITLSPLSGNISTKYYRSLAHRALKWHPRPARSTATISSFLYVFFTSLGRH
jgi:hypothetical protein